MSPIVLSPTLASGWLPVHVRGTLLNLVRAAYLLLGGAFLSLGGRAAATIGIAHLLLAFLVHKSSRGFTLSVVIGALDAILTALLFPVVAFGLGMSLNPQGHRIVLTWASVSVLGLALSASGAVGMRRQTRARSATLRR